MHERRVAHGNLKPGNVFFADDGEVLLSDWAMGNMPGAEQFVFTDAVLYQSPEQLRNPAAIWMRRATGGMFSRSACWPIGF